MCPNQLKKLPKESEDALNLVRQNICDAKKFMLIRRAFSNVLLACRNVNSLRNSFLNAMSCATVITFYKVVENSGKKSLVFLLQDVIKTIDKKQCIGYSLGSKAKKLASIRKRIKPFRDRVWGHALDFRKPAQGMGIRSELNLHKLDSYVNETEQYFNEIIELFEKMGYPASRYKIISNSLNDLEAEIDKFLSVNRYVLIKEKTFTKSALLKQNPPKVH